MAVGAASEKRGNSPPHNETVLIEHLLHILEQKKVQEVFFCD